MLEQVIASPYEKHEDFLYELSTNGASHTWNVNCYAESIAVSKEISILTGCFGDEWEDFVFAYVNHLHK